MSRILRACQLVSWAHSKQFRGQGSARVPYVTHLFDVASMVEKWVGSDDPTLIAAAILHDIVEDTDTSIDEVGSIFGPIVKDIVGHLTLPAHAVKEPVKTEYQSEKMRTMPLGAALIKIADKLSNVRDLGENPPKWKPEHIRAYMDNANKIVSVAKERVSPGSGLPYEGPVEWAIEDFEKEYAKQIHYLEIG